MDEPIYATIPYIKGFISPRKYVQGPKCINHTGKLVRAYGRKAFVFADNVVMGICKEPLSKSFRDHEIKAFFELFRMECSWDEVDRLSKIAKEQRAEMVIGVGGGKALDAAKAIGNMLDIKIILLPTIASTDAPTSAISVMYKEPYPGDFLELKFWPRNPDLVLVDTNVIAKAPARFLACGIGDATSHFFEGRAILQSGKCNFVWSEYEPQVSTPLRSTFLGFRLCKLTYELLRKYGVAGMEAAKRHVTTSALELVVEANILLSGLAFENTGCAAAHAMSEALTLLEKKMKPAQYHGELVRFGTIVQLVLENKPLNKIVDFMKWSHEVGLPINLEELGLREVTEEELWEVSEKAVAPQTPMHNEPFDVDAEKVFNSIKIADSIGRKVARIFPREKYE
ncbi:MAG: glycerol dehydrogenase [Candidatus Bathyarchaeia archaeon]